jgi:V8-like Glu-specific endopeptidase
LKYYHPIIAGNSGDPVIDSQNNIIRVAVTGAVEWIMKIMELF